MIITVLAEARSGSTSLASWFFGKKDFTVLYEPLNPLCPDYHKYATESSPKKWKYDTKHLLVKEMYGVDKNRLEELISISDRLIILYRENTQLQEESLKMAVHTDNWDRKWSYNPKVFGKLSEMNIDWFKETKARFKKEYVDNDSYFRISYEELYYKNGFQRMVDYIDLPEVQNIDFPYGTKYRVDTKVDKLL